MSKKRVITPVVVFLAVLAVVAAVVLLRARPVDPMDGARQALLQLAEAAKEGENAPDTLEDNGSQLVLRNSKTLDYLMEDIQLTKNVEDITGMALSTSPAPMYYFGSTQVGSDGSFIQSYGGKTFMFHLGYPYDQKFSRYVAALEESSPRYGIDTID